MGSNNGDKAYGVFEKYILRSPLSSLSRYKEFTKERVIPESTFKELCHDPVFMEALFLASPSFFFEVRKWIEGDTKGPKDVDKLKLSLLKYFSRMTSRCTPFGLFAGCTIGTFSDSSDVRLSNLDRYDRHTRLDMNFLVALAQDLAKNEDIKNQLLFFPNNSMYRAGDQLRFVEYYYKTTRRIHDMVAVDHSVYLDRIFSKALEGALLDELAKEIVEDDISFEDARSFIDELVESQLLISELEPSVCGPEFLDQLLDSLNKMQGTEAIIEVLTSAGQRMKHIDASLGNDPKMYLDLGESLKELGTNYELRFLFQTDLVLSSEKNTLDSSIMSDLKDALSVLNKLSVPPSSGPLLDFQNAFYDRFESREVPLTLALDIEMGVGYKNQYAYGDINPLVDSIMIPGKPPKHIQWDIKWNEINGYLQNKINKAINEEQHIVTLLDSEMENFPEDWSDLPNTISGLAEVLMDDGKPKVKLSGAGGSSTANLMARFCHGDQELKTHVESIVELEKEMSNDVILAEIVHLPESRAGNILMRPSLREFEIPYLAKSIKSPANQLTLDDLMVSVRNGRVFLRSKKLNKEVRPCLTNAHNFSLNSLPIYHFLCDLQTQQLRTGIGVNFGPFANNYRFLPRIEYKNVILLYAMWNLRKVDIEPLIKSQGDDANFWTEIQTIRETYNIPQYVRLSESDNELLVNMENLTSVRMLLDAVKQLSQFKLVEFVFGDNAIVGNGSEVFTNQVVFSFYNPSKLPNKHVN